MLLVTLCFFFETMPLSSLSGSWNKQLAVLETSSSRFLKQAASGSWNKQPFLFLKQTLLFLKQINKRLVFLLWNNAVVFFSLNSRTAPFLFWNKGLAFLLFLETKTFDSLNSWNKQFLKPFLFFSCFVFFFWNSKFLVVKQKVVFLLSCRCC